MFQTFTAPPGVVFLDGETRGERLGTERVLHTLGNDIARSISDLTATLVVGQTYVMARSPEAIAIKVVRNHEIT